ncbi:unnamed protein product [Meganyctiphanes norvegica]|uniref:Sodefrin-like factor n=1 Tax=Meganyctiphanes norvegica TaxID=48144 RepID=A0AAV2R663_MEGNR
MGFNNCLIMFYMSMILTTVYTLPDTCYHCTNNPGGDHAHRPIDPACGDRDYNGNQTHSTDSTYGFCCTVIYDSGYITRSESKTDLNYDAGGCYYESHRVFCACSSHDLCNTGMFCEQCDFPFSTLHTTTVTTTTTTTSEVITTFSTTNIITATSGASTTSPTEALSCYSCYDCPEVDANTKVVQDQDIASCVTTIILDEESHSVFRGDTHQEFIDGECRQYDGSLSCWCQTQLCNDHAVARLLDLQRDNMRKTTP